MPHLRIRGMKSEQVAHFSENIAVELAAIYQTTPDNFTVELIPTQFFVSGKVDSSYPFVEVLWFERSAEQKKEGAVMITEKIRQLTGAADIVVLYRALEKSDYFENGVHF